MGIPLLELLRLAEPISVPAEAPRADQWIPKLGVKGKSQGRKREFVCHIRKRGSSRIRLIFRKFIGFAVAASALGPVARRGRMSEVGFATKMALGSVGMVDRCSDFMRRAFPNGDIEAVGSHIDRAKESAW
jgi:hypothetical protein